MYPWILQSQRIVPSLTENVVPGCVWTQPSALVHGCPALLRKAPLIDSPGLRPIAHNLEMKSRVHPKYKTKYHVRNWTSYERALVRRGDLTVWLSPDAIAAWEPDGGGKRGGQRKYSDVAIETALTLRLLFQLPLRQAEGFLTSLFRLMGLDLPSPDHTTLSRRGQRLDVTLRHPPPDKRLHLIIDSTGLSMFGAGEWAAAKHGGHGKRGWKKLHLGVNRSGVIVARALTDATADDALTGVTLVGSGRRRCSQRHGGPSLRHDRLLRRRDRAWCEGRGATGQDGPAVPTRPAVERARSHDPKGHEDRSALVEEGGRVPSAGPCGECHLPVQIDARRWAASPDCRWAKWSRRCLRATCSIG